MILRRRDLPPVLLLILLILLIILTLTQILVVHSGLYSHLRSTNRIRRLQKELQELEASIGSVMVRDMPSVEKFEELVRLERSAVRISKIFKEAREYSQLIMESFSSFTNKKAATQKCQESGSNNSCIHPTVYQLYKEHLKDLNKVYRSKYDLPHCPAVPRSLKGAMNISIEIKNLTESLARRDLDSKVRVEPGGAWKPPDCMSRHRVAVIVPYRDRLIHLLVFLAHLHPMLQRQELDYRIFVVEQTGNQVFNKARLMNAGFIEASKLGIFDCFIFHDVDLIPEDDRNIYSCPSLPRHLSVAIDEMNYKLAYKELVGGVLNMRTEHFLRVNGYSNLYWGWGAEDDDMAYRIMVSSLRITRPPERVARYKMIRHTKRIPSDASKRLKLLYTGPRRYQVDGLNSLVYKRLQMINWPYYTYFLVDIGKPPKSAL